MVGKSQQKIIVVGAGLAGTLMAIYLGKRGFDVDVYERLDDIRIKPPKHNRSINMTLSVRGLRALAEVGLLEEILLATIPLGGRMVHSLRGTLLFQPYGRSREEVLYAIRRNDLHAILLNRLQDLPNVKMIFGHECARVEKETRTIWLQDRKAGREYSVVADLVIGADGAFSTVREHLQYHERSNYQQEFLEWGYKEITLPPGPGSSYLMEKNALHVWARGKSLLLAIPNPNGSFTCTCMLPFDGNPGFSTLHTEASVISFFQTFYSDVVPLIPDLSQAFLQSPMGNLVTIKTSPWYYKNQAVLIGDACHAVFPFYGQGVNAAFEDCSTLNRLIELHADNWERMFATYQGIRKKNTDVLADLSKENFIELRDKVESLTLLIRKRIDFFLNWLAPKAWIPLYTLVAHSTTPYYEALRQAKRQDRFLLAGGVSLALIICATLIWWLW